MDRKTKVSRTKGSKSVASLPTLARKESDHDHAHDAGSPRSRGKITKATRMKFLSGGGGKLKRSPEGGVRGALGSPNAQEPACDAAPANETQLERKRRLNRNNERKKRAKKILKIEDLTAKFHALTSENEALKAEGKELKEKIAGVKKFIEDQGRKPVAVVQTQTGSQAQGGANALTALGLAFQATVPPSGVGTSSTMMSQPSPPAFPSVISGLTSRATSISGPGESQVNPLSNVNLNFVPREQLIKLLQVEYEKQNRIIQQLRIHARMAEVGAPAPAPASAPAAPTATVQVAQASTPTVINRGEQIQVIIRGQATPPPFHLESSPAAAVAPLGTSTTVPALTLIDQLSRIGQGQCPSSINSSSLTTSETSSQGGGGGDLNNLLLQQQLLLALGAIQGQNQQQQQGGGGRTM